jgi:hypothetical protein
LVCRLLKPCNIGQGLNLSLQAICICFPFQTAQEVYFQIDGSDEVLGLCFEDGLLRFLVIRRHLSSGRGRLDIAGVGEHGVVQQTLTHSTLPIANHVAQ